jgi:RNA polymerase sigma factor (TIGR02999 family)
MRSEVITRSTKPRSSPASRDRLANENRGLDALMPRSPGEAEVTTLLGRWRAGDPAAFDVLFPKVYDVMRRIAGGLLAGERPGHTLTATALVHEAYFRLAGQDRAQIQDRAHLLSIAALAMRRILVSHARRRAAQKRGADPIAVTLVDAELAGAHGAADVVAMDDLVTRLGELDERQGKVVVFRYYGGMTDEEIAEVLAVSVPTVRRAWRAARAWLARELGAGRVAPA